MKGYRLNQIVGRVVRTVSCFKSNSHLLGIGFGLLSLGVVEAVDANERDKNLDLAVVQNLEKDLSSVDKGDSASRQRFAVRRAIRDAEKAIQAAAGKPERWPLLEFLFKARQRLVSLDNDKENRDALLATGAELLKAPNEFAQYRLEADLLLSQVEIAKLGGDKSKRSIALLQFAERYFGTPSAGRALRAACLIALERGDDLLTKVLKEKIAIYCAPDYSMVSFQRKHFTPLPFGTAFVGSLKRSDGKMVHFPMDGFGRSKIVIFWSKEDKGMEYIKGMAEASKSLEEPVKQHSEIISMNLDDLPDAGESIIRGLGVDWQCIHLPGGRENTIYKTYATRDPLRLKVSSTGQTAIVMKELERVRLKEDGSTDYQRSLGLKNMSPWMRPDYCIHLCSLSAGDFLIFDPTQPTFNKKSPPEQSVSTAQREDGVPANKLQEIQSCFIAPASFYQCTQPEMSAAYQKAVKLCREVISEHAGAHDLWLVRNRLIVSLMGLWRTESKLAYLEEAFVEAKLAIQAGYPEGADLVARFCLARQALRLEGAQKGLIIDRFVEESGGEQASGPSLAVACLLSQDVADRERFERFKKKILKLHTESPMMWLYSNSLLDRHHNYWRFQMPFYMGHYPPRRELAFKQQGFIEETRRMLKCELSLGEGKTFRIPEDLTAEHTAIFFCQPSPWGKETKQGFASPMRMVSGFARMANARPEKDVQTILAVFDEKPLANTMKEGKGKMVKEVKVPFSMMALPKKDQAILSHRLGMLFGRGGINSVLINKEGRILGAMSGIGRSSTTNEKALASVLTQMDLSRVSHMLENGKLEEAKKLIFSFVPEIGGNGKRKSLPSDDHLRARARVYQALGEDAKALVDIKEVITRHHNVSRLTSERTDQYVADEKFRDALLAKKAGSK